MPAPAGWIDLGAVGYTDLGNYNANTTYNKFNVVKYKGSSWVCQVDNTKGQTPAEGIYWHSMLDGVATATTENAGTVMPDGETVNVDEDGKISVPKATASALGLVKPDGTTITIADDGTISGAQTVDLTPYAKTEDMNVALAKKGETLEYDEDSSTLSMKSGDTVLSSVTIEGGSASLQLKITFDEAFKGQTYSITGGSESYTGTVPDSLVVIQKVKSYNTTFTVKSSIADGTEYSTTIKTEKYGGEYPGSLNTFKATINVSVTVGTAADTGATVEASNGTQTFTQTASAGKAAVTVGKAGTYTITVKKEGYPSVTSPETVSVTTDGSSLTGPSIDIFKATLTVKNDISAATVSGDNTVTVTDGTHSYSKTATGADLTFDILYAGTYTVTMSNGTDTATSSVDCKTSGGTPSVSMAYFSATIKVTTSEGASVQLYKGEATYDSAKTATDGTATFTVHEAGDYHAVASLDGETATSKTITIADGDSKTLDCAFSKIYGVRWNYGASSTALTRLTTSNDSVVTGSVSTEPTAAVGTGAGSSPFDDVYPWSDMEEYNVINNAVSYKRGESGFSRTSYDTVVKIPEFYYKVVQDTSAKTISYYISQKAADGFTKHPGSGRYVGRYNTGANYVTKSGLAPLVNITRATARTGSANHGSNWWQYDYATWCAVWMLYLVEFADWDSQSKVGRGYVDGNSSTINSGGTDSMTYFTGRAAGTDGKTAVQYRHIENPWGNVYEWVDGYNANGAAEYICTDPSKFADDTSSNYTSIGNHVATNAYISGLNVPSAAPYAFQPSAASGSETTYIPDSIYQSTGWRVLFVGGLWGDGSFAGLFYFRVASDSSNSDSSLGARLIYVP